MLVQVWASRHGPSSQADGMQGFLLSMLAVHLVQQRKLVSVATAHALLWYYYSFLDHVKPAMQC